ncbi:hypothetical protein CVT26_001357 [Gymnopilus dilepis]|uniref:Uncharacterized protein n=1 Tax=Gymnopilus dilepis TaxID=231916 RepID=A0A409WBJ3_9AGAR|nr:hypothetical protein CVT26_001357 [Gymnopilus dilepis]
MFQADVHEPLHPIAAPKARSLPPATIWWNILGFNNALHASSATTASKNVIYTHRESQDQNTFALPPSLEFFGCPRSRTFDSSAATTLYKPRKENDASEVAQAKINVKDRVQENCNLKIRFEPHKPRILKIESSLAVLPP